MEPNREYLRMPEVAELLRISRNRAYDIAASDPTFPVITLGRRLIVSRNELEAWLKGKQRRFRP